VAPATVFGTQRTERLKKASSDGYLGSMSDQPNLVLDLLRAMRGDIAQIKGDMVEVKERLGLIEGQYASLSRRVDRMGGDVELIKRRLDLVETP
jgi:hypothetical protein